MKVREGGILTMAYKKTDMIYILSTRMGYIPPLRQYGPIRNPIKITVGVAEQCIAIGVQISQFDPSTGKVLALDRNNLYDERKFEKLSEKKVPVISPPKVSMSSVIENTITREKRTESKPIPDMTNKINSVEETPLTVQEQIQKDTKSKNHK